jgi:guanine deaminase
MEASLGRDLGRARRVYGAVVRRTLAHGTTTAAYYATIDVAATNLLADLCLARGQRAFVGRVCMDRLGPDDYVDAGPAESLARTRSSVAHIRAIDPTFALISPILTPRFAPACTADTLAALGRLARGEDDPDSPSANWTPGEDAAFHLPIQTHISENPSEIALVGALFPQHASYAAVYDAHGLLGPRTVLAHAVHLTAAEATLCAARRAGVSHCPCSNSALTSGAARVRWLLARGLRVGLGTDVSGGYSASVLEAARQALLVSRHVAMEARVAGQEEEEEEDKEEEREHAKLSVDEVLYLATRGGAEILGLKERVGAFEVGMEFDAQLVSLGGVVGEIEEDDDEDEDEVQKVDRGNVDMFGWESWEERVAKWLFSGDDRNTKKVWVKGRLVHSRA